MTVWHRPSYGVFDFGQTNSHTSNCHYVADRNGTFLLDFVKEKIFEAKSYSPAMDPGGFKVFRLDVDNRRVVDLEDSHKLSESMWVPLTPDNTRVLQVGDTIRFGKQQLVVSAINLDANNGPATYLMNDNILDQKVARLQTTVFDKDSTCRICLEPNYPENPFVDICLCSRQMPMHLNCVREWMKRKCETSVSKRVVFFNLSEVQCEVCKTEYPGRVIIKGKVHMLFEPTVDNSRRSLVMNILDKRSFEVKGYTILYFDSPNERFTIGRTEENDISFNELSISRVHGELTLSREGVVVRDLKSKYGTLLKIRSLDMLERNGRHVVQIDKFLFEFHTFAGDLCFCHVPLDNVRAVEPFQGVLLQRKKTLPQVKSERVGRDVAEGTQRPPAGNAGSVSSTLEQLRQRAIEARNFTKAKNPEQILAQDDPEKLVTEENMRPSDVLFANPAETPQGGANEKVEFGNRSLMATTANPKTGRSFQNLNFGGAQSERATPVPSFQNPFQQAWGQAAQPGGRLQAPKRSSFANVSDLSLLDQSDSSFRFN